MMRWTVSFDIDSDDEQQVEAFAAFASNLDTEHAVEVRDFQIVCEGE